MMSTHNRGSMKQWACYVGRQLIEVFVIVAIGFSLMYSCETAAGVIVMGICYLIAIGAVIIVLLADDRDRQLKKRLRSGTL